MLKPIIHNILNQPTTWRKDADVFFTEKAGGFRIAINNGWQEYKVIHPIKIKLSLWDKIRLHRTIRKWEQKLVKITAKRISRQQQGRPRNTGTETRRWRTHVEDRYNTGNDVIRVVGAGGTAPHILVPNMVAGHNNIAQEEPDF